MKLSVIVPVYNMAADEKLTYCLESLIHQTIPAKDYEILAVDDASTDESFQILKDYEKRCTGLLHAVHSQVNLHQGGAKNIGLSLAKGDWISFIDADDFVAPDYYEKLFALAEKEGADMAGCDYNLTDKHSFAVGKRVAMNRPEQAGEMDEDHRRSLILDAGSLAVKIYRRRIIFGDQESQPRRRLSDRLYKAMSSDLYRDEKALQNRIAHRMRIFPEGIFYEDNAVKNTWILRARCFAYLPEPLYYYYQHQDSTVHTITKQNLEDRETAGRLIVEEARKYGYYETYKPEIEFVFTRLFYVNTLFSAMPRQQKIPGRYRFTRALGREMKRTFPGFEKNPYYKRRINKEEKKLIHMQMRSQLFFYLYYKLLWLYRDLRGKNKGA